MTAEAAFQPGDLLGGKYRLSAILGQGGMGAVYLAENQDIGRQVAIKVLRPELAADPDVIARFRQEARAAAAIGHPGIVDVLDMGTLPDGGAFIVMERLDGQTLRERMRDVGLPPAAAVLAMAEALDALAAAHGRGVIHRDLKPDNIFLVERPEPRVKLLDFGISKFRAKGDLALTRTGVVMGTPLYMSPEQARGARDVGPAADIYSVGAVLYEVLGGRPPFEGESYNEVLAQVLTEPPAPLRQSRPDLPEDLAALVDAMLAKAPAQRPQDAAAVASQLRSVVPSLPLPAGLAAVGVASLFKRTAPSAPRVGSAPPAVLGTGSASPRPLTARPVPAVGLSQPPASTPELRAATRNPATWILSVALLGAGGIIAYLLLHRAAPAAAPAQAIQAAPTQPAPPPPAPTPVAPPPAAKPPVLAQAPAPAPHAAPHAPTAHAANRPVPAKKTESPAVPTGAKAGGNAVLASPFSTFPDGAPAPAPMGPPPSAPRAAAPQPAVNGYGAPVQQPPAPWPPPAAPLPPPAKLRLDCVPWCRVFIDERFAGDSPLRDFMLLPGVHRVRVISPPASGDRQFELRMVSGQTITRVEHF